MIAQPVVRHVFLLTLGALALVSCAGTATEPRTTVGTRAADIALQQVGVPYRYGGRSPSGFDCSGLVHYSYAAVGKRLPRTTSAQWAEITPIERRDIEVGDLLFFRIGGKMSHVGMYLGDGQFVHAPSTGRSVAIESLSTEYYRNAFIRAGRPN